MVQLLVHLEQNKVFFIRNMFLTLKSQFIIKQNMFSDRGDSALSSGKNQKNPLGAAPGTASLDRVKNRKKFDIFKWTN